MNIVRKLLKIGVLTTALMLVLTSCLIVSPAPAFNVTYSATRAFNSDTARIRYTNSGGSLSTHTFAASTGSNQFETTQTANNGDLVEVIADNIFGEVTISMTVERASNNNVETILQKTCTTADTNDCKLSFTTP